MKNYLCPKCGSGAIMSCITVYSRAWVDINNFSVHDYISDPEYNENEDIKEVVCFDCEHEWEV